ncbi:MAG: TMEM165/GDT1 family protein [Bacillota bacterium]|jgi:putative Ca2+/H+ antiporter (TMEM165/GDT1 family)|nr:TMEM165/GDT1 family protein [Bacillota bacterium]MDD3298198.1 TMEM165/GDT1 family protein [Bacillota bacterium]MDD3851086.1 TMEM165/GDT1 family protein [Bacillota bacterium]MDD4707058.1 TMEM165/GDT1 family protein [Bacillota bacterium]
MDWKLFFTTFSMLFLAELGDKTQLAVFTLSTQSSSFMPVFLGASAALVVVTFIGVFLGRFISNYIPIPILHTAAGLLFVVMGICILKSSVPELSKYFRW